MKETTNRRERLDKLREELVLAFMQGRRDDYARLHQHLHSVLYEIRACNWVEAESKKKRKKVRPPKIIFHFKRDRHKTNAYYCGELYFHNKTVYLSVAKSPEDEERIRKKAQELIDQISPFDLKKFAAIWRGQ